MYLTRFLTISSALLAAAVAATASAQTPAQETLLTYAVSPSPAPLQASRPGSLRVVVSNNGARPVTVEWLDFSIPLATSGQPDAAALTEVNGGFGLESPGAGWSFQNLGNGRFRALPDASVRQITTQGLAFTISNIQVTPRVGTSRLTITERGSSGDQPPQERRSVVPLSKFPQGFTAGDLAASSPQVAFGERVTLSWEGSEAEYTILYDDTLARQPAGARTWTSPPLQRATTFILVARAQEDGSTVDEHFAVTVQVAKPSVVAHDLTVEGATTLQGTVRAAGRIYDSTGVVFPPGGIILWAGRTDQVPQGWALCDGRNGTPDLRGRFVVGWHPADRDYGTVGATGGAAQVALNAAQIPAHAHAGTTSPTGSHSHFTEGSSASGLAWRRRRYSGETTVDMYWGGGSDRDPGDEQWRGSVVTNTTGEHSHAFTTSEVGGGQPHENRPPYYVLAYIMKL
jgi:microcystin-dependent protein